MREGIPEGTKGINVLAMCGAIMVVGSLLRLCGVPVGPSFPVLFCAGWIIAEFVKQWVVGNKRGLR